MRQTRLEKLLTLDRRIIFLILAVVVIIPTLLKVRFPIGEPSGATKALFDEVEQIPEGGCVWVVLDYKPEAMAEVQPQLTAILNHCFSKNIKVLGLNPLIAESTPLGISELRKIGKKYDKTEGEDYVYLGYRPGGLAVMLGLGKKIDGIYKTDSRRIPIDEIPMMKEIKNYDNADLLISIAAFKTPGYWVQYVGGRFDVKVAAGVTGVMVPDMYPLYNAKQLIGILPGLRGAAEYEKLIGKAGLGYSGMSIQTFVHYALVLLIIFCNVAYFVIERQKAKALEDRRISDIKRSIGLE